LLEISEGCKKLLLVIFSAKKVSFFLLDFSTEFVELVFNFSSLIHQYSQSWITTFNTQK